MEQKKNTEIEGDPQYDPSLVVDKTEDINNLTCPICLGLVREPFDCVECDSTYCEKCIHDWFDKKNNCPQCRCTQRPKKGHKVIRAMLNSLKLHCVNRSKGCEAIITFQDIPTHKCDIFCDICEVGLKKQKHDCLKLLSDQVKRLKALKSEESALYNYLKSELLVLKNPRVKCNKNHEMILLNRACGWFCNECMGHFSRGEVAWLCAQCDHDICLACKTPSITRAAQKETKLVDQIKRREVYVVTTSSFPCKVKCKPCVLNLDFKSAKKCNLCGNTNNSNWSCSKCTFSVCTMCSPISILSNIVTKPIPRYNY